MKQTIIVIFTIAISIVLLSCNKEEKTFSLIATTEKCINDKTLLERHYDDNGNEYFDIKWEIGDGICIYSISGDLGAVYEDYYYVHSISQDGRTAYFLNSLDGNEILNVSDINPIAFYPPILETYGGEYLSEEDSYYMYTGNPIFFLNPGQSYSETNVIRGFPMASLVNEDLSNRNHLHLSFYNICGLLRIKIKDGRDSITRVKKVRISSSNNISGYFGFRFPYEYSLPEALELESVEGTFHFGGGYEGYERFISGTNYIELTCSNANNGTGVPLASDGTDFYFYVPPTMMNDMVIEVTNMDDEVATKDLSGHNIQVMRSQLTGIKVDFTNVPFI